MADLSRRSGPVRGRTWFDGWRAGQCEDDSYLVLALTCIGSGMGMGFSIAMLFI